MPKAFPLEFRRDVIAVARRKEAPMSQIARDFGISDFRSRQGMSARRVSPRSLKLRHGLSGHARTGA